MDTNDTPKTFVEKLHVHMPVHNFLLAIALMCIAGVALGIFVYVGNGNASASVTDIQYGEHGKLRMCVHIPCAAEDISKDIESETVLVAHTNELRTQGLSDTLSIAPYAGMLFVFSTDSFYSIWMKDMNYPIDILWLDSMYRVVHIEAQADPAEFPRTYVSDVPARYVLELPAGNAVERGIYIGSQLYFDSVK